MDTEAAAPSFTGVHFSETTLPCKNQDLRGHRYSATPDRWPSQA
ncbi:Protein of unknown function [Gryllus bimaculatus]|nr:Protein of unknown function [Gryllus bimaculatus]